MTHSLPLVRLRPLLWFGGALGLLVSLEHLVTTTAAFASQPLLPYAVTADVVGGIPLLYYLLVVRPYRLPLASLAAVTGACLALVTAARLASRPRCRRSVTCRLC